MSQLPGNELKKAYAVWDKNLRDAGFNDIEDRNSETESLKSWHSCYFQCRYTPEEFEAKKAYYELAADFLHRNFFEERTLEYFGIVDQEKKVWELHASGMSIRDIADALRTKKCRVEKTINILTDQMMKSR